MNFPELNLRISFATNPFDAEDDYTDIPNVQHAIIIRGRQHELDRIVPGIMRAEIFNRSGDLWPIKESNVVPGKKINLQAQWNDTTYDLYTGFVDDWAPGWIDKTVPVVRPSCVDVLSFLANIDLIADYPQEPSGDRIGRVLDEVGWPGVLDWRLGEEGYSELGETTYLSYRRLDEGQSEIQATDQRINAFDHIVNVQNTELGLVYQRADGNVNYDDRLRRITDYTESRFTFEERHYQKLDIHCSINDIYNDITLERTGGEPQRAENEGSQEAYGRRTYFRSGHLHTSDLEVEDHANFLASMYAEPRLRIRRVKISPSGNPELWPVILSLELNNRITLVNDEAGIDKEYFIEGIEHDIDYNRGIWEVFYQLSPADLMSYWILGTENLSELNETAILGY